MSRKEGQGKIECGYRTCRQAQVFFVLWQSVKVAVLVLTSWDLGPYLNFNLFIQTNFLIASQKTSCKRFYICFRWLGKRSNDGQVHFYWRSRGQFGCNIHLVSFVFLQWKYQKNVTTRTRTTRASAETTTIPITTTSLTMAYGCTDGKNRISDRPAILIECNWK